MTTNIRKSIAALIALALVLSLCAACTAGTTSTQSSTGGSQSTQTSSNSSSAAPTKTCHVMMPDGLPAVGLVQLASQVAGLDDYALTFEVLSTPDTLIASVLRGDPDIAVVPSNAAATQYNKGAGYLIAGTVSQGSSFLVTSDSGIESLADLAGQTVYNIGRGLTPDLVFRTLLHEQGVDAESIDFTYVSAASELLPAVISGQAAIAVVPEPALTTLLAKMPDLRIVADLNALWQQSFPGTNGFPQASLIVKESLALESPDFVAHFMEQAAASERAVYDDPDAVGATFASLGISVDPASLASSERFNLIFTPAAQAQADYTAYFAALNDLDPATIGGSIPDAAIFHTQD